MSAPQHSINFCQPILDAAMRHPERPALTLAGQGASAISRTWTYAEFMQIVARHQQRLQTRGLGQGDRVLVLTRPGIALYGLMIAMLASGVVPVMVERGMPRNKLRALLGQSRLKAVIGEKAVLKFWPLFPALWRMPRWSVDGLAWGLKDWHAGDGSLTAQGPTWPQCTPLSPEAHGIITFTSGSTGLPKGADRTHASLVAQHLAIRAHWPDVEGDIDLPSFPVLVLHNLCCGLHTVMPDTDLGFPAQVRAERVLHQVVQHGVTRLTGSPAYMEGLTQWAQQQGQSFESVRSVVIGGATLTKPLALRCREVFPKAETQIVYGSTEAEPIAEVLLDELLADWHVHAGHLVGKPASATQVRIVSMAADLSSEAAVQQATLPQGQEGEVLVAGEHVLRAYVDNPQATAENKIPRADGLVWHRTGDTAFFDEQGRLWLTGRVRDRVLIQGQWTSPFPIEKELDALPGIRRSAILNKSQTQVVDGSQSSTSSPVIVVVQGEPQDWSAFHAVLQAAGLQSSQQGEQQAQQVQQLQWAQVQDMPVDMRHNSKLDRPTLRDRLAKGVIQASPLPPISTHARKVAA